MAFAAVESIQEWSDGGTMAEMHDWNLQMQQMSSAWGVNAMSMPSVAGHDQMDNMWTSMQPVPLLLAQEVPEHALQGVQEHGVHTANQPQFVCDMQQWDSMQMGPPPPQWYPSMQLGETEEGSAAAVQIVADLLRSSDAKTKWITYCVANGVQFAMQPEEYDHNFLRRFLDFYRTGLSMAQEQASGDAVAAAWGGTEDEQAPATLMWLGGGEEHTDGKLAEPGYNVWSDKIQASVTKFLEGGLEEGESDADDDDDMDEVIKSFMVGGPELYNKTAATVPFVPDSLAAQMSSQTTLAAAVAAPGAVLQHYGLFPTQPPPPPPPETFPAVRQPPPGTFKPQQAPAGFTLQSGPPLSMPQPQQAPVGFTLQSELAATDASFPWPKASTASMIGNQAPPAGTAGGALARNPSQVTSVPSAPAAHLGDGKQYSAVPASTEANKSLVDCMRDLFCEGAIPYDVRIIVDDGMLRAHRFFLTSRCVYFQNMLQGSTGPNPWQQQAEMRVSGLTVDVMKHVLYYIYTNKIDYSLDDRDSLQPQELEYCIHLCDVADRLGLPGLSKLLTSEVLIPVAETLKECDYVQERRRREQRASNALAALSAAALNSAAALGAAARNSAAALNSSPMNRHGPPVTFTPQHNADHHVHTPVATLLLEEQVVDTSQSVDAEHNSRYSEEFSDARTQKLLAGIMSAGSTTVMIRNLPRSVKQKRLLKEIDGTGFADTYDFAYLPSSFGRGVESSGLGYAFVNFEEVDSVVQFVQVWHGSRRFSMTKSDAAVTVSVAEHQGKDVNVRAWMRKGVRVRNPDLRPFIKGDSPWEIEEERAITPAGLVIAGNEAVPDEGQAQDGE